MICSSPIPQKCRVEFKSVSWLASLFALVSGALITCQVGSNTQLKKSLGQPLPALLLIYLFGIGFIFFYTVVRRVALPPIERALGTPWWGWLGELFGAAYALVAIV